MFLASSKAFCTFALKINKNAVFLKAVIFLQERSQKTFCRTPTGCRYNANHGLCCLYLLLFISWFQQLASFKLVFVVSCKVRPENLTIQVSTCTRQMAYQFLHVLPKGQLHIGSQHFLSGYLFVSWDNSFRAGEVWVWCRYQLCPLTQSSCSPILHQLKKPLYSK